MTENGVSADGPYDRTFFCAEDEAGVTFDQFHAALSVWAWMQPGSKPTVRAASQAFNVTDQTIREAVEEHYWMFLSGPDDDPTKQIIEHDGE